MSYRSAGLAALLAATLASLACSKDTQNAPAGPDASSSTIPGCTTGADCAAGDCINGACVWCTDSSCAGDTYCSLNGKCLSCDGGCVAPEPVDAGPLLDAGTPCTSRADCAGLACRAGFCAPQDPSGVCVTGDDCNAGNACTAGACVVGCATRADCAGSATGPRCDPATGRCGPCASAADCNAATENCLGGKCLAATSCPGGDRSVCLDLACIDALCRPCAQPSDCGVGFDCRSGGCVERVGCTQDSQCLTLTAGHWCDLDTNLCVWGCLAGTGCGQNCCPSKQVCNTTTHACDPAPCNDCGGTCVAPQVCNESICACGAAPYDGGVVQCSDIDCSCPGGLTCKALVNTPPLCSAGVCL